jgi:hypothetical protein
VTEEKRSIPGTLSAQLPFFQDHFFCTLDGRQEISPRQVGSESTTPAFHILLPGTSLPVGSGFHAVFRGVVRFPLRFYCAHSTRTAGNKSPKNVPTGQTVDSGLLAELLISYSNPYHTFSILSLSSFLTSNGIMLSVFSAICSTSGLLP